MANGSVVQSGVESLIWGFSPFLGLKKDTSNLFWKEENIRFPAARNRLLTIGFNELIENINFQQSKVEIQKNQIKLNILIDTENLYKRVSEHNRLLDFDNRLLKQKLGKISFDWKRPLSTAGWKQISDLNTQTLQKLGANQILELVQRIYLESIDYQLLQTREFMTKYLSQVEKKDSILYGNLHYTFKEAFSGLSNLRDHTFLTLKEIQGQINPTSTFISFNETFSKAYLGYLDFVLSFNDLPTKREEQLNHIRTAREDYLELLAGLGLLQPVKLSVPQIETLLQMTEAL